MAKKDKNKIDKNDVEDIKTKGANILEQGLDGKQRVVTLEAIGKNFKVSKLDQNAPYSETFSSETEAREKYSEKIHCTNN